MHLHLVAYFYFVQILHRAEFLYPVLRKARKVFARYVDNSLGRSLYVGRLVQHRQRSKIRHYALFGNFGGFGFIADLAACVRELQVLRPVHWLKREVFLPAVPIYLIGYRERQCALGLHYVQQGKHGLGRGFGIIPPGYLAVKKQPLGHSLYLGGLRADFRQRTQGGRLGGKGVPIPNPTLFLGGKIGSGQFILFHTG